MLKEDKERYTNSLGWRKKTGEEQTDEQRKREGGQPSILIKNSLEVGIEQ